MTVPSVPPLPGLRRAPETDLRPSRASAAIVEALERVCGEAHRWLDQIEAQARAIGQAAAEMSGSTALAQGLDELEQERARLRAEAERRDREWQSRLDTLERDRQLLAEAWERLEREQVASLLPGSHAGPHPGPGSSRPPTPAPSRAPGAEDDPIARTILRQFEALRHDVRLRAEVRPPDPSR